MIRLGPLLCLVLVTIVNGYPKLFESTKFKVGIEYDGSLPMKGGSDKFRHRNNYDPFFVTITAKAKDGFVISYLEVTATIDEGGEVDFSLISGRTGSKSMVFQLVSNHSDFLAYSYLAYGIREELYNKMANVILVPVPNKGIGIHTNGLTIMTVILLLLFTYIL